MGRLSYGVTSIMCQYSDNLCVGMNGSIDVVFKRGSEIQFVSAKVDQDEDQRREQEASPIDHIGINKVYIYIYISTGL